MFLVRASALFFILSTTIIWAKPQQVVLSAGGTVTIYRLNSETGTLTATQELELQGAGPFTASNDKKFLYVCAGIKAEGSKKIQPAIATFALLPKGKIKHLHTAPIATGKPGYLDVSANGKYLAANCYRDGTATVWETDKNGIYSGKEIQTLQLEKKAHSSIFSPSNEWLLVPATEPNKVFVNRFDAATGESTPTAPGHGPTGEERRSPGLIFSMVILHFLFH